MLRERRLRRLQSRALNDRQSHRSLQTLDLPFSCSKNKSTSAELTRQVALGGAERLFGISSAPSPICFIPHTARVFNVPGGSKPQRSSLLHSAASKAFNAFSQHLCEIKKTSSPPRKQQECGWSLHRLPLLRLTMN